MTLVRDVFLSFKQLLLILPLTQSLVQNRPLLLFQVTYISVAYGCRICSSIRLRLWMSRDTLEMQMNTYTCSAAHSVSDEGRGEEEAHKTRCRFRVTWNNRTTVKEQERGIAKIWRIIQQVNWLWGRSEGGSRKVAACQGEEDLKLVLLVTNCNAALVHMYHCS